jgi:plasmid maintenance system antidote protein VapI
MNKYLKAKIVERYGSQFEFARAIAEHEAVVSRVIRGHRDLTPEEKARWANALGYDDAKSLFRK